MELRLAAQKKYGPFSLAVDFTVSGERIGIFGESGSGKSTLVGLLAGLYPPDSGEIYLDGECLYSSSKGSSIPAEKRRIAIVFQHSCLFPHLSVRGNLLYGYNRCPVALRQIDFNSVVTALQLEGLLERGVGNLSGGEKQRVALGRAVLSNPRLLIMDEPLTAMDDGLKFQIIPYLKAVSETFAIPFLFISHSMVEMRLMTDQALVVDGGKVTEQLATEQLARKRMQYSQAGYINLLHLVGGRKVDSLSAYSWGGRELFISAANGPEATYELSSKDIILFKQHPEAISARNLLVCRVVGTFESGNKVGVDLECGGDRLVAEVVRQAAEELAIREGSEIYAAIKASAFRKLG